jgi:hypothetical protein
MDACRGEAAIANDCTYMYSGHLTTTWKDGVTPIVHGLLNFSSVDVFKFSEPSTESPIDIHSLHVGELFLGSALRVAHSAKVQPFAHAILRRVMC